MPDVKVLADFLAQAEAADAWELAMHLISAHADPMAVARSYADNTGQHDYEHTGPGTVRGHSRLRRDWDEGKIELVLEECEANP